MRFALLPFIRWMTPTEIGNHTFGDFRALLQLRIRHPTGRV
jgi:hypothetical protein